MSKVKSACFAQDQHFNQQVQCIDFSISFSSMKIKSNSMIRDLDAWFAKQNKIRGLNLSFGIWIVNCKSEMKVNSQKTCEFEFILAQL